MCPNKDGVLLVHFAVTRWHQLKQKYDLSAHEVALTEGKMKASSHHKQLEEVAGLQKTVGTLSHWLYLQTVGGPTGIHRPLRVIFFQLCIPKVERIPHDTSISRHVSLIAYYRPFLHT